MKSKPTTQEEFNAAFEKKAFRDFLKTLDSSTVIINSGTECLLGKFFQAQYPDLFVSVGWTTVSIGSLNFHYPEWAKKFLDYLSTIRRNNTEEIRLQSIAFLK